MKRDINTLSLLNEISELVYVSDPETYELLFVNQTGCQTLHLENYKHKKCYEILQGKTSPCEFCTNDRLCDDNFYTWEFTNPSIGRHFLLKDKIIQWRGKTARMEIAFDITERELQKQELKNMLDVQTLITNCVRMLYAVDDLDQTINAVLTQIGEFLVSDRAYVFEIKDELMNNTHEWTAPGISPQLEKLQQLDLSLISDWLPFFEKNDCIIIDDVEQLQKTNPAAYATLHAQEITSLIAAPIFLVTSWQAISASIITTVKKQKFFLFAAFHVHFSFLCDQTSESCRYAASPQLPRSADERTEQKRFYGRAQSVQAGTICFCRHYLYRYQRYEGNQ